MMKKNNVVIRKFYSFLFPSWLETGFSVFALYLSCKFLLLTLSQYESFGRFIPSLLSWISIKLSWISIKTGVPESYFFSVEAFIIATFFLTLILIPFSTVKVFQDGIHAYNYTRMSASTTWNDIHSVSSNFLYTPFTR